MSLAKDSQSERTFDADQDIRIDIFHNKVADIWDDALLVDCAIFSTKLVQVDLELINGWVGRRFRSNAR